MATKLMPLRPSGSALRSLSRRRPSQRVFSTTPATASLSPQSKSNKKITSSPTRRTQATAAAPAPYECLPPLVLCLNSIDTDWQTRQTRPIPSPAFNQDFRRNDVSPLQNRQMPEMDES